MTTADRVPVGKDSDDADLATLWDRFGADALRFATVLVGPDDAHDITVTAFLRVFPISGLNVVREPRSYLMRAVANQARDLRRQRFRRWRRDLAAVGPATTAGPESHADVRHQIARLSVAQRAVVFLTYWEDMTESAIATLLGVSTGTVHRNLSRARTQLRRTLQ